MNTSKHSSVARAPQLDVETLGDINVIAKVDSDSSIQHDVPPTPTLLRGRLTNWNAKVEGLAGLEARGIKSLQPEGKHPGGIGIYL